MKILLLVLCSWLFVFVNVPMWASASSAQAVIYQVQTGGSGTVTASEELVIIKNASTAPLNVTNWCVQYSSATNGNDFSTLGCSLTSQPNTELWLEAGKLMSFASDQFTLKNAGFTTDFKISAGMATAGGHIRLVNDAAQEVDRVGWGTALHPEGAAAIVHAPGQILKRKSLTEPSDSDNNANDFMSEAWGGAITTGVYEAEIVVDVCSNIDGMQMSVPEGYGFDQGATCVLDICQNIEGLQAALPVGYQSAPNSTMCEIILLEDRPLLITEILPNVPGYDDGLEFIEIFNPNPDTVDLHGYTLSLGPTHESAYTFDEGEISPGQYIAVSDVVSGITLPNSSAFLRLIAPNGNIVSETIVYDNPEEGLSWAVIEDQWTFTNQVTRGGANKPNLEVVEDEAVLGITTVFAPCPMGKFRNPATNRCKSVEVLVSDTATCKEGEYRNPATNRCKNVASSGTSLVACKEGQARNPDTNRCKNIGSTTSNNLVPCDPGEERNPATNRCRKIVGNDLENGGLAQVKDVESKQSDMPINFLLIGALLICAAVYVCYEWRSEIRQRFLSLGARFGLKTKNPVVYERFL